MHRRDPRGPGRQGPGRRPSTWSTRPTSTPSCWCASREELGHRPGRPAAAEPDLAGQGRGRLHDRPLRGRLGRASGCAARRASCPRPGAAQVDQAGAPYVSVWFRRGRLRPPARRGPCARGPSTGPAPEAAAAGGARGAQGRAGAARDQGGPARATRGGPGSRARSRKGCAPSACAAAATAGWPGRTCSTWRPRPRSTSSASPPGSGRSRAPPPAPPASPPSHGLSRLRQRYPGDVAAARLGRTGLRNARRWRR